ncbi:hypothetical protein AQJ46_04725 [Streptomyces canus]|uniref:Uncharacterized protein n=1 Tax=Streptomyces canus TaxID=58343 RepID=A0A117R6S1_9ACTN|nr:hypothetical protein AQJ46_04725 [Streptomyces canus]
MSSAWARARWWVGSAGAPSLTVTPAAAVTACTAAAGRSGWIGSPEYCMSRVAQWPIPSRIRSRVS